MRTHRRSGAYAHDNGVVRLGRFGYGRYYGVRPAPKNFCI